MSAAARLASLFSAKYPNVDSVDSVETPVCDSFGTKDTIDIKEYRKNEVQNQDGERVSEAAYLATERAAIIAESQHGNPAAPVPHHLPPSWADARITPTAGARCSCCRHGATWWCETAEPTGWRCAACHPPGHLAAGQFREVVT
jgi:hypothetical protein